MYPCFRYGKQHVPITAEDLREQSYSEARTFQLVGFLPRDQVPRHWYVTCDV